MNISDVWGIGRKLSKIMTVMGLNNALDLAKYPAGLARKEFNIEVERTARELNGQPCKNWDVAKADKKQIYSTRSVGERITELSTLQQALSQRPGIASRKAVNNIHCVKSCCASPQAHRLMINLLATVQFIIFHTRHQMWIKLRKLQPD